jgi:hypothetical protein
MNKQFFSVSQYKDFLRCESMAMAKINGTYSQPKSEALLLGSLLDELLTGTKKSQIEFIAENYAELFQKSSKVYSELNKIEEVDRVPILTEWYSEGFFNTENKPYANVAQAIQTAAKVRQQPLMMKHLSGQKQKIMTGEISGVPFKIKMDSYKKGEFIADLKYMKSLRSPNMFESMVKYWGYDIQGAIYQEIVRQNTGKRLPFFLVIATKETPVHLDDAEIKQYDLDAALEEVKKRIEKFHAIKSGEILPERCEEYDCNYCTETRILTEPIDSNMLGMARKIDA